MITVPLGRTTGCPPRPAAPSLLARDGPQLSPPSVDVRSRIALPEPEMSLPARHHGELRGAVTAVIRARCKPGV
jgi:hypothetical protein